MRRGLYVASATVCVGVALIAAIYLARQNEPSSVLTPEDVARIEETKQELLDCQGKELLVFRNGNVEMVANVGSRSVLIRRSFGGYPDEIILSMRQEWVGGIERVVSPDEEEYPTLAARFLLQQ